MRPSLSLVQGAYFVATGLWPVVHWRSFEAVTGPKQEVWLVKTMGGLITAVGAALLAGGLERSPARAQRVLGVGSALALGLAELIYGARGRISPVYLMDAVVEGGIVGGWLSRL
jgi:hypothetical protein